MALGVSELDRQISFVGGQRLPERKKNKRFKKVRGKVSN